MSPLVEQVTREEHRRHGRIRTTRLLARLGRSRNSTVDNISASGIGLRYKGRPRHQVGDFVGLMLQWRKASIPVKATVISVNTEGGQTALGLQFQNLNESQIGAIRSLAIQARNWEV